MQLRTEIEIDAPPATVWQVLTDFGGYPEWNPFIVSIDGPLSPGAELRVALSPPESREYHILPQVVRCEPEQELRWRGQWGARFLFQGEHFFRLVPLEGGRTRFVHGEDFSGILVRWLGRQLTHVARGFVFMNQALKRRVEGESFRAERTAATHHSADSAS